MPLHAWKNDVRAMVEVPCRLQPDRLQRDFLTAVRVAIRRRRCAGEAVEKIVEGAILLNDDDDVLILPLDAAVMRSF